MSEITQCFVASEPVSINVFNAFRELEKETERMERVMIRFRHKYHNLRDQVNKIKVGEG